MKPPFPGMDPYIEASGLWADFHNHLVERIGDSLADSTPERYLVRTGERSYVVLVEPRGKQEYPFLPDVSVTTRRGRKKPASKGTTAVAEPSGPAAPVEMRPFIREEHREKFVEIYEGKPERRLVTIIEVLSPSNKRPNSPGWDEYQRKRQSALLDGVNLVEIDLLRGGERMPMLSPWPDSPYAFAVARALAAAFLVWPVHIQHPLPPLPVPLLSPDPDIPLNLQPMIEAIYRRFRYEQSIDYTRPLAPPLMPEEAVWLERQLQARRKGRTKS